MKMSWISSLLKECSALLKRLVQVHWLLVLHDLVHGHQGVVSSKLLHRQVPTCLQEGDHRGLLVKSSQGSQHLVHDDLEVVVVIFGKGSCSGIYCAQIIQAPYTSVDLYSISKNRKEYAFCYGPQPVLGHHVGQLADGIA